MREEPQNNQKNTGRFELNPDTSNHPEVEELFQDIVENGLVTKSPSDPSGRPCDLDHPDHRV